jgi:hypothetical protein
MPSGANAKQLSNMNGADFSIVIRRAQRLSLFALLGAMFLGLRSAASEISIPAGARSIHFFSP